MPRPGCSTAASCCSGQRTGAAAACPSTTSWTWCPRTGRRQRPSPVVSSRTGRPVADAGRSRPEPRGSAGAETRLGVRAALPAGLLQHLAVLVLPHLLAPLLDDRTQANSCACLIYQLGLTQPPRAARNDSAVRPVPVSGTWLAGHTI